MTIEQSRDRAPITSRPEFGTSEPRTAASYEYEIRLHRRTELGLRVALAEQHALLQLSEERLQQRDVLGAEADHRLLNGLQMVVSFLALQSRASASEETASQLAAAGDRVMAIARVHRLLNSFDGKRTVAFSKYIEELCRDFSTLVSSDEHAGRTIHVEGPEITLPVATAVSLGFVVSELITNAAKHGAGNILVSLEAGPAKGYALSVSNDASVLPEGFNPGAGKGVGMTIVRSFVEKIGGELRFGRSDNDAGTRFTVLFA